MNRKLLQGLLIAATLFGSVGIFSSCKDTEEGLRDELLAGQVDLNGYLKTLETLHNKDVHRLDSLRDALQNKLTNDFNDSLGHKANKQDVVNNALAIAELQAKVKTDSTSIAQLWALINGDENNPSLSDQIADAASIANAANAAATNAQTAATNAQTTATAAQNAATAAQTAANKAQHDVDSLKNVLAHLATCNCNLDSLAGLITALDTKTAGVVTWFTTNKTMLENLGSTITDLQNADIQLAANDSILNEAITELSGKHDALALEVDTLKNILGDLTLSVDSLKARVAANEADILRIDTSLSNLLERYNNLVTGILIQGTNNPVFGSLALPLDVRTNVLMSFYGYSSLATHEFPSMSTTPEATYSADNAGTYWTAADFQMLVLSGYQAINVEQGSTLFDENEGNAGIVYVTVNPTSVDFNKLSVSLVNSVDKESGVKLSPLTTSDKVLTFGYSRAANNGFYASKATLKAQDINSVKIEIEEGLKTAAKEAIKDRTASDLAALGQKLYRQFNGFLPANGIKCSWQDGENVNSVYSQYAIAATAVKPLSYKTLEGFSMPRKLPIITPLKEQLADFNFDDIVGEINIKLDSINIDLSGIDTNITIDSIKITDLGSVSVSYDVPKVENGQVVVDAQGNAVYETKTAEASLDSIANKLNEQLNKQFGEISTQISNKLASIVETISTQIQNEVNNMLSSISGQIDEQVQQIVENIKNNLNNKVEGILDKVDGFIAKYNSWAKRINGLLEDPNHYLQVTMLYRGVDGGYHQLSNSAANPSQFTLTASGAGIELMPTSYTAEVVAPAYRKFVAVTNVWKGNKSAQGGDADCQQALKDANNLEGMCEVIPGTQHAVPFAPAAGYKYEITYSGLDFHGYTSTRKFYVVVK